jgi:hypothetical protein
MMTAIYYEIRIAGLVPPDALRGFEQLAATQPAETVLRGSLPDRAALNGLLARLEWSDVQLMRLRKLEPPMCGRKVSATSARWPAHAQHGAARPG